MVLSFNSYLLLLFAKSTSNRVPNEMSVTMKKLTAASPCYIRTFYISRMLVLLPVLLLMFAFNLTS